MSIWEVLIIIIFYFVVKYIAALVFWGAAFKLITTSVKKGVEEIGSKSGLSDLFGDGRPKGAADTSKQRTMSKDSSKESKAPAEGKTEGRVSA